VVVIGIVLSCEHASWTLPPGVDLGVSDDVLRSQAGWDHGAYDIAQRWSEGLGLHVHAGLFSRMFVDLNRGPDHPGAVPNVSYGALVPGNAHLSDGDRAARIATYHAPYWQAVRRDVKARVMDCQRVVHVCSHSFDPGLDPSARTYDCGVLYDPQHPFEAEMSERLLFHMRGLGFDARANQPYPGVGASICTALRTELGEHYAGIQFETSHRVTYSAGGCERIAAAVLQFLEALQEN
jgi:predicted N-formylglutamate amidohydrolase